MCVESWFTWWMYYAIFPPKIRSPVIRCRGALYYYYFYYILFIVICRFNSLGFPWWKIAVCYRSCYHSGKLLHLQQQGPPCLAVLLAQFLIAMGLLPAACVELALPRVFWVVHGHWMLSVYFEINGYGCLQNSHELKMWGSDWFVWLFALEEGVFRAHSETFSWCYCAWTTTKHIPRWI